MKILYTVGYYYYSGCEEPDFINLVALFDEKATTTEVITELNYIIESNFYKGWLVDWKVVENEGC